MRKLDYSPFVQTDAQYTEHSTQTTEQASSKEDTDSSFSPEYKNKKRFRKANRIFSYIALVVVTGTALFFSNRVTKPVYVPKKSSAAFFDNAKYMNVYYLPPESPWATKSAELADKREATRIYLGYASAYQHNINNQIVSFTEVVPPILRSEKRPVITGVKGEGPTKAATIQKMFNEQRASEGGKSICQLIEANDLDQVWLWVDPDVDLVKGDEFEIVNSTSNYGTLYFGSNICGTSRTFTIMGFGVNAPVENAVHSYAHYMETLLKNIEGPELVQGLFQGVQPKQSDTVKSVPIPPYLLSERCGNVHTPPNVPLDSLNEYPGYDYSNTAVVNSMCDHWQPDGLGQKTPVSYSNWKNMVLPQVPHSAVISEPGAYTIWWMQNMPQTGSSQIYNGKPLPAWWDFVVNTDQKVKQTFVNNYWLNPALHEPVDANPTAFCTAGSGLTSSCSSSGSTLGAHTESDSVLGTSTYGNLAVVTVAYSGTNPTVTSATFCGTAMSRIGTGPSLGGGMKTEMWYLTNPPAGSCPIVVTFSAEPGQRVISSTIFNNIDQVSPVGTYTTGGYTGTYSNNPGSISATLSGPKDSLMLCTYAQYSEQTNLPSPNYATAINGTLQLWKFEDSTISNGANANIWAGLGAGSQRSADNQNTTLGWTFVKTQPSTYTCANVNVKPFTIPVTPPPTPTPTVDLKISNSDGPVTVPYNSSATISWTSTNTSSCTASGSWSGTKGTTGSETLSALVTNGTYSLNCNGATDSVSIVVSAPPTTALPTVDLKMNNGDIYFFDTSLKTLLAQKYTLSWTSTNATSCAIKYGDWLGATVTQPTKGTVSLGTGGTSNAWQLNCTGPNGTASDVTRVIPIRSTKGGIPTVGLFANNVDTAPYTGDGGVIRSLAIKSGTPVTLTWAVASSTSCTASGSWTGAKAVTGGTQSMGAITTAKIYTLTCVSGTYTASTSVRVTIK